MFWGEEKKRKTLPMRRKRQVYERAKARCEKCGTRLKMNEGDFHHTRDPTVTPRAANIRFLCPTCHRKYGHKRKTRTKELLFGTEKEVKVIRKDVVKIAKPAKKKAKTKRAAIRGIFGDVIGYKTVKIRKTKTTKKKTTSKKPRKKTTAKKKAIRKKTKRKTS